MARPSLVKDARRGLRSAVSSGCSTIATVISDPSLPPEPMLIDGGSRIGTDNDNVSDNSDVHERSTSTKKRSKKHGSKKKSKSKSKSKRKSKHRKKKTKKKKKSQSSGQNQSNVYCMELDGVEYMLMSAEDLNLSIDKIRTCHACKKYIHFDSEMWGRSCSNGKRIKAPFWHPNCFKQCMM